METVERDDFFRAFGRLEARIEVLDRSLSDMRLELRENHSRRWQAWAGVMGAVVSAVLSGVLLFHFGVR